MIQNANETSEGKAEIYIGKDKLLKRLDDYMTATNEIGAQYMKSDELDEKQFGIILGSFEIIYKLILDVHSGALDYDEEIYDKVYGRQNTMSHNEPYLETTRKFFESQGIHPRQLDLSKEEDRNASFVATLCPTEEKIIIK